MQLFGLHEQNGWVNYKTKYRKEKSQVRPHSETILLKSSSGDLICVFSFTRDLNNVITNLYFCNQKSEMSIHTRKSLIEFSLYQIILSAVQNDFISLYSCHMSTIVLFVLLIFLGIWERFMIKAL